MAFKPAQRKQVKIKIAICGPSGGGKTYSALLLAKGLAAGKKIALIDTENESASLYAGSPGIPEFDTDVISPPFLTKKYIEKIKEAERAGYEVLILDSISHQWNGEGGIMDRIDKEKIANPKLNSFTVWSKYTPEHEEFKQAILQSPMHIICTIRSKTAYVLTENDRGKAAPKRAGMESIQRDGIDYEFSTVFEMEPEKHFVTVNKDRTGLFDGQNFIPTEETGRKLLAWIQTGLWTPSEADLRKLQSIVTSVSWSKARALKLCHDTFEGRGPRELNQNEFAELCRLVGVTALSEAQAIIEAQKAKVADAVIEQVEQKEQAEWEKEVETGPIGGAK